MEAVLPVPDSAEDFERLVKSIRILDVVLRKLSAHTAGENTYNRHQAVASKLIPSSATIVYGIHALLAEYLLIPAEILFRSLTDRVSTLTYLHKNGDAGLDSWEKGWSLSSGPSFSKKLESLPNQFSLSGVSDEFEIGWIKEKLVELKKSMNGTVHGSIESTEKTIITKEAAYNLHLIGADRENVGYRKNLCTLTCVLVFLLIFEIEESFWPKLEVSE